MPYTVFDCMMHPIHPKCDMGSIASGSMRRASQRMSRAASVGMHVTLRGRRRLAPALPAFCGPSASGRSGLGSTAGLGITRRLSKLDMKAAKSS